MIDLHAEIVAAIKSIILVVAALFPIVNPLGSAAIFVNMVGTVSPQVHRALSQKIAIFSFLLLMGSLLLGAKVLSFFGISLYAVQIGGGLVVAVTGWSLLNRGGGRTTETASTGDDVMVNAFYPYTLPITVGPGSISVAVTLGAHLPSEMHAPSILSPRVLLAASTGIILICLIIYFCYRYASAAQKRLGTSGTSVLMRLSSFILLCIGVQIVLTGIKTYIQTLQHF